MPTKRGYSLPSGHRWAKLRKLALERDQYLCQDCLLVGRISWADEVDHVKPISQGGELYPPLDGLRSLCVSCHEKKTNLELGRKPRAKVDPTDEFGFPTDPNHHWNAKK